MSYLRNLNSHSFYPCICAIFNKYSPPLSYAFLFCQRSVFPIKEPVHVLWNIYHYINVFIIYSYALML